MQIKDETSAVVKSFHGVSVCVEGLEGVRGEGG